MQDQKNLKCDVCGKPVWGNDGVEHDHDSGHVVHPETGKVVFACDECINKLADQKASR